MHIISYEYDMTAAARAGVRLVRYDTKATSEYEQQHHHVKYLVGSSYYSSSMLVNLVPVLVRRTSECNFSKLAKKGRLAVIPTNYLHPILQLLASSLLPV